MALARKPAGQRDLDQRGVGGKAPFRPRDPGRKNLGLQRYAARGAEHPVQVKF